MHLDFFAQGDVGAGVGHFRGVAGEAQGGLEAGEGFGKMQLGLVDVPAQEVGAGKAGREVGGKGEGKRAGRWPAFLSPGCWFLAARVVYYFFKSERSLVRRAVGRNWSSNLRPCTTPKMSA